MGSINNVHEIDRWNISREDQNEKIKDDIICEVMIGSCSDGNEYYNIFEYISKENYIKLTKGEYTYKIFPNSNQKIMIFDKNNNIIPLVKGRDDEYSNTQVEYIKQLVKK